MRRLVNLFMHRRVGLALLAFGLLLGGIGVGGDLAAQTGTDEVRVVSMVEAAHRNLTLLDICDQAGLSEQLKGIFGKVSLGEAPSVGSTKTAEGQAMRDFVTRLLESRGMDPSKVRLTVPDRIQITRLSVTLTAEKIEEIFKRHVLEHTRWSPQDIEIQKVNYSGLPVVPAGDLSVEIAAAPQERYAGNVCVTLHFSVDGEKVRSLSVAGKVDVYQNVVQASRPLKQSQVLAEGDIEMARVNVAEALDRYATDVDQIVNKRLLRNVGAHQAISLKDLDKPLVLKRGDMVTMIYSQPGLKVTAKGQVREDGSIGDTVRINNVNSNRVVYCRVIDAETVHVSR